MVGDVKEQKHLLSSSSSDIGSAVDIWRVGHANTTRLMLNNVVMSDTADEHIYHELLVHPALIAAKAEPK